MPLMPYMSPAAIGCRVVIAGGGFGVPLPDCFQYGIGAAESRR